MVGDVASDLFKNFMEFGEVMESVVAKGGSGGSAGRRAVAYLRVVKPGLWGAINMFEQKYSFMGFGRLEDYALVRWYIEGVGSDSDGYALGRLMEDAVSPGRDFDNVLVWKFPHLGYGEVGLAEVRRTLEFNRVRLVSVGASPWGKSNEANPDSFR